MKPEAFGWEAMIRLARRVAVKVMGNKKMRLGRKLRLSIGMCLLCTIGIGIAVESGQAAAPAGKALFPRSLESYGDQDMTGIMAILWNRLQEEPFNLAATLIFFCAIVHTFLSSKFMSMAHRWEHEHAEKILGDALQFLSFGLSDNELERRL